MVRKENTILPRRSKKYVHGIVIALLIFLPKTIQAGSEDPRSFSIFFTYNEDLDLIASRFSTVIWHKRPEIVSNLPLLRQIRKT